jgi:hypothetical protein
MGTVSDYTPDEPQEPQVTQPNPVPPAPGRDLSLPPNVKNLNGEEVTDPPSAFRVIRERESPDAPPGLKTLRPTTPQQRDVLSRFIAESPNPASEMARQAVVDYLHVITGEPRAKLASNYNAEIRRYAGVDLEPMRAFEATKQWWDSAWLSYEANQLKQQFHEQLRDGGDVTALAEQITNLENRIAGTEALSRNPFFNSFVQPAVRNLPMMLDPMLEGSTVGMAAAGGAYAASLLATGGVSAIAAPVLTYSLVGTAAAAAGTAVESARMATGEMTWELFGITDEQGNRIDPRLATTISGVAGGLVGLIEAVQIAQLVPGGEQVFRGIVGRFTEKLYMNRVLRNRALQAVARYGVNVTDEALEELQQETVQSIARQLAIDVQNNTEGDFDRLRFEEEAVRALQAFSEGWRASAVLALPSNIIQTGGDIAAAREERRNRPSGAAESIAADTVATEQEAARQEARERVRPMVQDFEAPEQMRELTEVEAEFDETARSMRELMEQATEEPGQQEAIDQTARRLFELSVEMEQIEGTTRAQADPEETPEIARMTREQWQASQREGEALTAGAEPEAAVATGEMVMEPETREPAPPQRELRPRDPALVERVREGFPTITDEEQIEGLAMILELRADAVNMDPTEYIERSLSPESFTEYTPDPNDPLAERRAGVFRVDPEDGRAIIQWTKNTQFSDAVHELGHLFEHQLSQENHNQIVQFFADDGMTWDTAARERFAEAWETYILKGEAPRPELRNIFERFADWMRQIYQRITASNIQITPEVRQVFDAILTEDPTAQIVPTRSREELLAQAVRENRQIAEDLELFQTRQQQTETRAFTDWFGRSHVTDAEGRPQVVYHGTKTPFTRFDPEVAGIATNTADAMEGFFFSDNPAVAAEYAADRAPIPEGLSVDTTDDGLVATFGYMEDGEPITETRTYERVGHNQYADPDDPDFPMTRDEIVDMLEDEAAYARRETYSSDRAGELPGAQVMPVYLSMENPRIVDRQGEEWSPEEYAEEIEAAQAAGNDGVIFRNAQEGTQDTATTYFVFQPEQIKSAIANRGTFDRTNPDILYSTRAYHGAPHDFTTFSLEKIGTGEGAQAFGWGLYFTSDQSIARWYAKKLSKRPQKTSVDIVSDNADHLISQLAESRMQPKQSAIIDLNMLAQQDPRNLAQNLLDSAADRTELAAERDADAAQYREQAQALPPGAERTSASMWAQSMEQTAHELRQEGRILREIADLVGTEIIVDVTAGTGRNLYTVTLDPEQQEDRWLVYDQPIADQPRVLEAMERIGQKSPGFFPLLEPAERQRMLDEISLYEQSYQAALGRVYDFMQAYDFPNSQARAVDSAEAYTRADAMSDLRELQATKYAEPTPEETEQAETLRKELSTAVTEMLAVRQRNSMARDIFESWKGSDLYQYLENQFRRIGSRRPDQMASVTLADEGIVGNDYPAGTLSGVQSDARNYVVFDDSIIQVDEKIAFSTAKDAADEHNLILHNMRPEDIMKVAELGGMPLPSLAVTRESVPHIGGFGAVTLVAPAETLDSIDVYDRDIYSPRVPQPEWKENRKAFEKLWWPIYDQRKRFPEDEPGGASFPRTAYVGDMDQEVKDPSAAYDYLYDNLSARLQYLDEHGIDYDVPTKPQAEPDAMTYGPLVQAIQDAKLGTQPQFAEIPQEVWDAADQAWDLQAEVLAATYENETERQMILDEYQSARERTTAFENKLMTVIREHAKIAGGREVTDLDQIKADLIDEWTHDDYDEWLREKIKPVFSDPRITVGGKKVPFTLPNIAEHMRRQAQVASEETMTFGPKKAAAMAARRVETIQQIKEQNYRIDHSERVEGFASLEQAQTEIQEIALPYFKYDDVWDGLNSFYEALGRYLKRSPKRRAAGILRQELARQDFSRPNDTDTERIMDYAEALASIHVNYLEGRARNSMYFDDFVAAVVPADIDDNARATLAEAGVAIREYEPGNSEDRWRKVMDSANHAGNVLFSTRRDPDAELGIPDEHELAVQETIDEGKWVEDEIVAEYAGRQWADRELAERTSLRRDAARSLEAGESVEEFTQMMMVMDQAEHTANYYHRIYQTATNLPAKTPEQIAQEWTQSLTKEALSAYLRQVKMNRAADALPHNVAASITKSMGPATELTDTQYQKIMDQVRARPHEWFETLNALTENDEDLRLMEQAMQENPEEAEIQRLRRQVDELRAQDKRLNADLETLRRQIELDRRYENDLQGKIERIQDEARTERELAREAVQSARQEARRQRAVSRQEQHRELVEERKRVRQQIRDEISVRNYVKKLIKQIMQRPGPSIEYHYAQRILEIQEGLDTRSHRRGVRGKMTKYMRDSDVERLSDEALRMILEIELGKASLPDMNIEMLENVLKEIEGLREAGRQAMKERVEAQKKQDLEDVEELVKELGGSGFLMNLETEKSKRDLESGFLTKAAFNVYSNKRITRMLGTRWSELFDQEINRRTDEKLTYKYAKIDELNRLKDRTGVTARQLMEMANEYLTVNQIVGIHIFMQNEDSAAAVRMGNQIDIENMRFAEQYMQEHPELREFADGLMGLFDDESFERMQQVFIRNTNQAMERVENYFPMRRQQIGNTPFDQELNEDLLSRTFAGKTYAWKGFTERRQHARRMGQNPIRLDAYNIAVENIEKQEHYTAMADHIKRLHRLLGNRSVQEAFVTKHGRQAFNTMREYVSRVANPAVHRAQTDAGRFFQDLRGNMTVGALAFNLTSPIKNVVGPMLYLPYISDNPVEATARLTASMFTVLYDKQARDFIRQNDPQVRERELDPALREASAIARMGGNRIRGFIQEWGMKPLQAVDTWTVMAGEWAVYSAEMAKHGDQARAVKAMQEATLLTQPFSQEKDTPAIYTDNTAKMFLMFSSPLNQIFGMVTRDAPQMLRDGRAMSAGLMMASLVLTGVALRSIGRKRLPDEPEEWIMDVMSQFVEMVPFIGPEIMMAVERNPFAGQGVSVTEPFVEGVRAIQRASDSEADAMQKWNAAVRAASEGMRIVGLPGVQANRLYRIFINETGSIDPWYLVGGEPEPPSEEE